LKSEHRVHRSFKHDRSTLAVARQKFAAQIAAALVEEIFKAVQP
jgi:hypothetical protein